MLKSIGGAITAQELNDNFSYLDSEKVGKNDLRFVDIRDYGALGDEITDDTAAFQACFQNERNIFIPNGTYLIRDNIEVNENTRVFMQPNAVLKRDSGNVTNMFYNGEWGGTYTGYDGRGNITFVGGTFEGNTDNYPQPFNFFSIGHAKNIVLKDLKLYNNSTYHFIEINSSRDVLIDNCYFEGYLLDPSFPDQFRLTEAVQLDYAGSQSQFGPFGSYDNTPVKNIRITNCTFKDIDRGIGSHSYTSGIFHENIFITHNLFENCANEAFITDNYQNVVFANNVVDGVRSGVRVRERIVSDIPRNIVVANNVFRNITNGSSLRHAIYASNEAGGAVRNIAIANNTIYTTQQSAIYLNFAEHCSIVGNTIENSNSDGIAISETKYSTVANNVINQSVGKGIYVITNSQNNNIDGNNIRNASEGIHVTGTCSGNLLTCNHLNGTGLTDNGSSTQFGNVV